MTKTDLIISAAGACIGTPFVPQGRLPGIGLDCGGLIVHALRAGGLAVADVDAYRFPPAPDLLTACLRDNGFSKGDFIVPGALLLFRFSGRAQHLALATSNVTMIHAYAPVGQVVETGIGDAWLPRLIGIYTHKDL